MIVCKNLNPIDKIQSVSEWFLKCPPQKGVNQWKDGRSAKETAKLWINGIPNEFKNLLYKFNLEYNLCSPEYLSCLDNLRGNSRNHDLIILAEDFKEEQTLITIESKVDEPFDKTVSEYLSEIKNKKLKNIPTKADIRIKMLLNALLSQTNPKIFNRIRYQFLTSIGGTLFEARKRNIKKAIFIVQTLITDEMDYVKYFANQKDFDFFIDIFTNGIYSGINDGELLGPYYVPGNKFIPNDISLWIGKYSINI